MQLPSVILENWLPPLLYISKCFEVWRNRKTMGGDDLRSNESAEGSTSRARGVGKLQVLANGRLLGVLQRDRGEGLDVQVRALGARLDELSGESEDRAGLESGIKGSGDGLGAGCDANESLVAGLDSDNGSSGGKDIGGVDHRCGTEVGGDTDGLKNTCGLDHGVGAGQGCVEVVLARLDGLGACTSNSGHQSGDVSGLSLADAHERLDLSRAESKSLEVAHGELGETLLVECRLEVLSGQGTVVVSRSRFRCVDNTYNWRMSTSLSVAAAAGAADVPDAAEEAEDEAAEEAAEDEA
jgi:hypothetical protein